MRIADAVNAGAWRFSGRQKSLHRFRLFLEYQPGMKKIIGFLVAVSVAFLLASIFASVGNVGALAAMDVPVSGETMLSVIAHDLPGLFPAFFPLVLIALFLAWLFTGQVLGRMFSTSAWLYALAGLIGMIVLHSIMYIVFGISPIAATRTLEGLLVQGMAGAIAGWCFYRLALRS